MSNFALADDCYVHPTPAGAFYALSSSEPNVSRRMIQALLQEESSPRLSSERLVEWTGLTDPQQASSLLYHAQNLGWVQGLTSPARCEQSPLEQQMPGLLRVMTSQGKALIADQQGFYLATVGFQHEVAEELAALSAELATVYSRRSGLLNTSLGLASNAWAIVDAAGASKVGFWPLYIGFQRFVLVISGMPKFNHPEFVNLAWVLNRRYSALAE